MDQEAEAKAARARITAANQRNSPLLRLPAELRNRIYEYTLGGHEIWLGAFSSKTKSAKLGIYSSGDTPPFELLEVCSQVNAEAARLPYSLNTFVFNEPCVLDLFLKTVPMSVPQMIRTLRLLCWNIFDDSHGVPAFSLSPFEGLQELQINGREMMSFPGDRPEETKARLSTMLTQLKAGRPNLKVIVQEMYTKSSRTKYH